MRTWLFALLLCLCGGAFAQQRPTPPCAGVSIPHGCYSQLRDGNGRLFRDNDPFLFCTAGMRERPRAWNPVNPRLGLWAPTPGWCPYPMRRCPYPLTALIGWTQREIDGVQLYMRVCPANGGEGRWQGNGRADQSPHRH